MNVLTESKSRVFVRADDRCDRCGAVATYAAIKGDQELLFCNHHFNKHSVALIELEWNFIKNEDPQD